MPDNDSSFDIRVGGRCFHLRGWQAVVAGLGCMSLILVTLMGIAVVFVVGVVAIVGRHP